MFVWWGRELTQFYNDGYIPMLGARHPDALGRSASSVWADVWPIVGPQAEAVMREGRSTWNEELLLIVERNQFREESYFTFSYSPAFDDSGAIGGVFCAVSEDTHRVLSRRRLRALRVLAERTADARSVETACTMAAAVLAEHDVDVPFAIVYLTEADGLAHRAAWSGLEDGHAAAPENISLEQLEAMWPIAQPDLAPHSVEVRAPAPWLPPLPGGRWPEPTTRVVLLPLERTGTSGPAGLVIAGISPRLIFDADYRSFLELTAGHIATAVTSARAFEAERARAEALAELDRAKTMFFSNVSHEFRTPLTLMLGPLEDLLADEGNRLAPSVVAALETAHRNGLRLMRLVNTLLDFSRIQAGRIHARYEPTDLSRLTIDVASNFRSAIERAGLRFRVECPAIDQPVFVDRDMWQKIVLNLLSNALKFTFDGEIAIRLEASESQVQLIVSDTGVGIPPHEISRDFERFHRVDRTRSRTHEGSGIGLALVEELAILHGGTVRVESTPDRGSRFTVTVPLGRDHLDAEHVDEGPAAGRAETNHADSFVQEAIKWLPDDYAVDETSLSASASRDRLDEGRRPRILIADDNADMREYVRRLLLPRFDVETVTTGREALDAARRDRPDLLLTDIMMPEMDGSELVAAIRADARLRDLPVIMLSARAGEASRIEGLEAGADDYLVKPFGGRELVARVSTQVELARMRREVMMKAAREKDEFIAVLAHELRNPLAPIRNSTALLRTQATADPVLRRCRDIIDRQVVQMARLLDDLLDVSRLSQGKLTLLKERVLLRDVVDAAIETARPLIDERSHTLLVEPAAEPIVVDADSARLTQVLSNVLNNAAKYTDDGGRITVRVEREGNVARIRVSDTGIGIEPDVREHMFELFTQAEEARGRAHGGLGIGLGLARRLIELHGGAIEARSGGAGQGSEFIVTLPLATAPIG
jgi:signal transduction histidine kinase